MYLDVNCIFLIVHNPRAMTLHLVFPIRNRVYQRTLPPLLKAFIIAPRITHSTSDPGPSVYRPLNYAVDHVVYHQQSSVLPCFTNDLSAENILSFFTRLVPPLEVSPISTVHVWYHSGAPWMIIPIVAWIGRTPVLCWSSPRDPLSSRRCLRAGPSPIWSHCRYGWHLWVLLVGVLSNNFIDIQEHEGVTSTWTYVYRLRLPLLTSSLLWVLQAILPPSR